MSSVKSSSSSDCLRLEPKLNFPRVVWDLNQKSWLFQLKLGLFKTWMKACCLGFGCRPHFLNFECIIRSLMHTKGLVRVRNQCFHKTIVIVLSLIVSGLRASLVNRWILQMRSGSILLFREGPIEFRSCLLKEFFFLMYCIQ